MTTLQLHQRTSVPCAGGVLELEPHGEVTVSCGNRSPVTARSPDIALSNFVELWCNDDYGYLVGLKGKAVWFVRPCAGELVKVLELDRLDLEGSYDPGGLHRVAFYELDDADLLLVYELGAARVSPQGTCRWSQSHDQLPARLDRIVGDTVWFKGEYEEFGFSLDDGRPVYPTGGART